MAMGLVVATSTLVPTSSGAQNPPVRDRAELTGTGDWSINSQMNAWKAALYYSAQATDLSYLAKGDRDGRQIFARGDADFVVTGLPLTAEDQAALAARKVSTVSVPISVASAAMFMSGPFPTGLRTFTPDPVDPEGEGTFAPYTGALRMPNTTLAKVLLDRGTNNWYDADFLAANASLLPAGSSWAPVINPTLPVVRSDPSAINEYMQQLAQKFAPQEFLLKVAESKLDAFEVTESWPFLSTGSRSGSVNTASLVAGWQNPKEGVVPYGGVLAPVPVNEAIAQRAGHPETPLFIAEVQNAAGEWVAPTPATISKAIAEGNGEPLAALSTAIPGAYPLAWVNRLIAPTSGLDIDSTNAVATLVRFAVTAGQDSSTTLGEGRLSESLVAEALNGADAIVTGNCTGSDRKVVQSADGGPLWPTGVAIPVGTFRVCMDATAPSTTTTTTVRSSVTSSPGAVVAGVSDSGGGSGYSSGSSSSGPSGSTGYSSGSSSYPGSGDGVDTSYGGPGPELAGADGTVSDLGATSTNAPTISPELAGASLPMGMPDTGRGSLDRLTTMLLGAVLVAVGRSFTRRSKVVT